MIARLSGLDDLRSARAAGGHHGKNTADHYRPESQPNHVYVVNCKTSTGLWKPLSMPRGKALYPLLMAELDAMKALRPKGGLMLRRDGSGLPWGGGGEILTQVERISKKTILAAGLRPELTFTSLGPMAVPPATRAATREIACQQPAESSGGRGSRRGERWYDCGSLADLTGGPLQTLRTNGRTPRGPLLKSRAKGVFQGGRMPCACCARARPRPSNHPSLPGHRRPGRARSG